jgi:hypothetical protein
MYTGILTPRVGVGGESRGGGDEGVLDLGMGGGRPMIQEEAMIQEEVDALMGGVLVDGARDLQTQCTNNTRGTAPRIPSPSLPLSPPPAPSPSLPTHLSPATAAAQLQYTSPITGAQNRSASPAAGAGVKGGEVGNGIVYALDDADSSRLVLYKMCSL